MTSCSRDASASNSFISKDLDSNFSLFTPKACKSEFKSVVNAYNISCFVSKVSFTVSISDFFVFKSAMN